jgi:hypothetical protein
MMIQLLLLLMLQDEATLRDAVKRALPLLQKSGVEYTENRSCFSCHHQTYPINALTTAKRHGFEIDDQKLADSIEFTAKSLARGKADYVKGRGQGGQVDTASSGLWTLAVGGRKADDVTALVAGFLVETQSKNTYWSPTSKRPPLEQSLFTSTAMTIRALKDYGTAEPKPAIDARIEKAKVWLKATTPADTEDLVSRLRALSYCGMEVKDAVRDLVGAQRDDGGWAQLRTLESDAYATGSALVALHEAGGIPTTDGLYTRGVKYLFATQKEDGSWHVKTRSKPIQAYFESGFPHEKDQFISISATAWSVTALALACSK